MCVCVCKHAWVEHYSLFSLSFSVVFSFGHPNYVCAHGMGVGGSRRKKKRGEIKEIKNAGGGRKREKERERGRHGVGEVCGRESFLASAWDGRAPDDN